MKPTNTHDPKLAALEDSGTLNHQAHRVKDVAFVASDFFDSRDLVQVRYEMLRRVHIEGQAIAVVAENFGVSRPTFYKAQADFERTGLAGLLPVKRGPRSPHKITVHFGLAVHRRTVERALTRAKKKP
jgi:hypothetical protein